MRGFLCAALALLAFLAASALIFALAHRSELKLLGFGKPARYTIIYQNNAELRSQGGIAGGLISATLHNGQIALAGFHSDDDFRSEKCPNYQPLPQTPEEDFLSAEITSHFVNATESIDFRRVVEIADDYYAQCYPDEFAGEASREIDGTILLDPYFLADLIAIHGDVRINDDLTLTEANAAQLLLNGVYLKFGDNSEGADAFFEQVATAVLQEVKDDIRHLRIQKIHQYFELLRASPHLKNDIPNYARYDDVTDEQSSKFYIYLNEYNPSKTDWYAQYEVSETLIEGAQTRHPEEAQRPSGPSDDAPESANEASSVTDRAGYDTWQIDLHITNTLPKGAVAQTPQYITGPWNERIRGYLYQSATLIAPKGAEVLYASANSPTPEGADLPASRKGTLFEKSAYTQDFYLPPEEETDVFFIVRTPSEEAAPPKIARFD